MMLKNLLSTIAFTAITMGVAQAADQGDIALELIAGWVVLPEAERGDVVVQGCDTCESREYTISESTSFEINGTQVRLSAFRAEIRTNPNALVLLQLTPDRRQVARLKLYASPR